MVNEGKDSIDKAIAAGIELELKAAALYRFFAKRFSGNEELVVFWNTIALEEEGHADILKIERRMIEKVGFAFSGLNFDVNEILKAVEEVDEICKGAMRHDVTELESIKAAITIENTLDETKYVGLLDVSNAALKRAFERILADTVRHAKDIERMAKKYGADT